MPRRLSEERTRKEMIDPQLERADWYLRDHARVKIEIPVDGYDAEPWNGVTDYTLYRENGEVLALVETKRTTHDARLAEAQLTHYVTEIEKHQSFRPFGFLANGFEIYFADIGISAKREVFGFFTREDLETLLYIRQNSAWTSEPSRLIYVCVIALKSYRLSLVYPRARGERCESKSGDFSSPLF